MTTSLTTSSARPAVARIRMRGQGVERYADEAQTRNLVDHLEDVTSPLVRGSLELDVEDAAGEGEIGRAKLGEIVGKARPGLACGTAPGSGDHRRRSVVT